MGKALGSETQEQLRELIAEHGLEEVAERLEVSEGVLARAGCGIEVNRGLAKAITSGVEDFDDEDDDEDQDDEDSDEDAA